MIKVLGLDSVSKDTSIVKNKMTLAERRLTKKVRAAKEAGGKNQSDAITKTCEKLQDVSRDLCCETQPTEEEKHRNFCMWQIVDFQLTPCLGELH